MHAAEVAQTLPVARLDDTALSAVRLLVAHGLPGLVIADEADRIVACVSAMDLLRLALPAYMLEDPSLARVLREDAADGVAARLVDMTLRHVVTKTAGCVPEARAEATVAELAELMARRGCSLALVRSETGGTHGVVTVNRLLEALAAGVAGDPAP